MEKDKNNRNINAGSLPNARAGQPYRTQIDRDYLPSNPLAVCWFDGLEQTGLHFFPDKKQITGIPKNSGSFDMQLNIREYNESGMEELSTRALHLLVEDDYDFELGEVDENALYWKRDDDVHTVPVNRAGKKRLKKDIAAASRRGHQHIEAGKIREDDFYIRYDTETRWYALAVSDGADGSKYSRKGSQIVCNSAVKSCLERLAAQSCGLKRLTVRYSRRRSDQLRREIVRRLHDIIASSVRRAYEDIVTEATALGCQPGDYAATLLMCICKKFEFGWLIGVFSVGDGAVCVYRKDDWYANLMGGGECPAEKCFLTSPGIIQPAELEQRICFTIVADFSALFLMTNGVSDPKFGTDLPCFELWNRFWDDLTSEVNFPGEIKDAGEGLLKWLDFWTPGKYDDRTVAVLF